MLKSMKSEIAESRSFWVAIDSDDAAFFAWFIGEIGGMVIWAGGFCGEEGGNGVRGGFDGGLFVGLRRWKTGFKRGLEEGFKRSRRREKGVVLEG